MSLATNVSNLATAVATEIKKTRTWVNGNAVDLSALTTTANGNLVAAINEVAASAASATGIDDNTTTITTTWSSQKISDELAAVEIDPTDLIEDTTPSTTTVYSSTKTDSQIGAASTADRARGNHTGTQPSSTITNFDADVDARIETRLGTAPANLDTLTEIAARLEDDSDTLGAITTSLTKRVAVDAVQAFTTGEQTQARGNIAAAAAADVGDLTGWDPVAVFEAGLA